MSRTISGTYTALVTLGAADNPTTITATALLEAGLLAAPMSSAWTIANAGSIAGGAGGEVTNFQGSTDTGGAGGVGVALSGGMLTNSNSIAGGAGGAVNDPLAHLIHRIYPTCV